MHMPMNPQTIMGLGRKFQEARIVLTAAELGLFTLLAKGPLTSAEVASRREISPRGIAILLDAFKP